jgi:hypothetical protein
MSTLNSTLHGRARSKGGFAIGPILFIIALIAVIGAALSSGSGGFNASSGEETARVNATNIMGQGTNYKIAIDRLASNGFSVPTAPGVVSQAAGATVAADGIDFTVDCSGTSSPADGSNCLYTTLGGAISRQTPPAKGVPAATITATTPYQFHVVDMPGIGLAANEDLVVTVPVSQPVCEKIVTSLYGTSATVGAHGGTPAITTGAVTDFDTPAASTSVTGRMANCVSSGTDYLFYQVLNAK